MYKTKLFEGQWTETQINEWLEENPNITIISSNTFANHGGWGYIILYKELFPTKKEIRNELA